MFKKAVRSQSKARVCIAGPAGSGKTYSSLLMASGLGNKIAMIDTEHGSGALYSDLVNYDILELQPPFEPEKYIKAIKEAENTGYDVIIIDSLSHAWAGEGGLLDMKEKVVQAGKGNDWTAWRHVTPIHNKLVEAILQSKRHVIATARSKMKYAAEEEGGRIKKVKKIGLDPVLREGMEYEFTIVFDLSSEHVASCSKDRTRLFDGKYITPTKETGRVLHNWLMAAAASPTAKEEIKEESGEEGKEKIKEEAKEGIKDELNEQIDKFIKEIEKMKGRVDQEKYDEICKPYLPLKDLKDRNKQVELYNKLKKSELFV